MTLSVKNNNPLNVRATEENLWKGELTKVGDEFEVFDKWLNGLRAGIKNMAHHVNNGKRTIRLLVQTWAPPTENKTDEYISYVSKQSGFGVDQQLQWNQFYFVPIIKAMIKIESGVTVTDAEIVKAWEMI